MADSGRNRITAAFTMVGLFMVVAGFLAMAVQFPFAFSVTSLAWGGINIALAQIFRNKEALREIEQRKLALQYEAAERSEMRRLEMLERLSTSGALAGTTLTEISRYLETEPAGFLPESLPPTAQPGP